MKKLVIALGGNALQESGKPATAEAQLEIVRKTSGYIADIIEKGYQVAVAHGNGPQVGRIVMQNEYANSVTPAMPFDVCGAMSQGYIGYHIQQSLSEVLRERKHPTPVVTVVTQVVVEKNDPKFKTPSKPIGPFYQEGEAKALEAEKGYIMKEDAGRGWRRVVASPQPVSIVELDAVKCLLNNGFIVVTVGGGGIPVIRGENGELSGTAAVIDKDLASEKLAEDLDAGVLLILTAVEKVSLNYHKPNQKNLDTLSVSDAKKYITEGQFAPGSMLPKMEAAIKFAESKPGRKAIITSLDKAVDALEGKAGTTVLPTIEETLKSAENKPGRKAILPSLDKTAAALKGKAGTASC